MSGASGAEFARQRRLASCKSPDRPHVGGCENSHAPGRPSTRRRRLLLPRLRGRWTRSWIACSPARAGPARPRPKALIVPHAGYVYSGPIAATRVRAARAAAATHRASRAPRARAPRARRRARVAGRRSAAHAARATSWSTRRARRVPTCPRAARRTSASTRSRSSCRSCSRSRRTRASSRSVGGRARGPKRSRACSSALWGGPETVIVVSSDLSHYLPYDVGRERRRAHRRAHRRARTDPLSGDEACGAARHQRPPRGGARRGMRAELARSAELGRHGRPARRGRRVRRVRVLRGGAS